MTVRRVPFEGRIEHTAAPLGIVESKLNGDGNEDAVFWLGVDAHW